jgi:hypothetical protein
MKMKLLVAALLVGASMPADAATFLHYTAYGHTVSETYIDVQVDFWYNPAYGCLAQLQCGLSGSALTFKYLPFGQSVTLKFDHTLASMPTAVGFTGGTYSYLCCSPGGVNSTREVATLRDLTFETVETSPFSDGGFTVKVTRSATPEPATWALMIGGFAMVGAAMRRRVPFAFA